MGSILDFLIVAFVLFLLVSKIVKAAEGKLIKGKKEEAPSTKECPFCLEIVPIQGNPVQVMHLGAASVRGRGFAR
jgi:large conductance mechanosensitive channel